LVGSPSFRRYKSLNTFIDDLFSFVIKMPWLHRLSCFRDDIIFFIYLYQRWVYRVDYSRTNEYGQSGPEQQEQQQQQQLQQGQQEGQQEGTKALTDQAPSDT